MKTVTQRNPRLAADPISECAEAKQLIDTFSELIDELRGMTTYLDLLRDVASSRKFSHRRVDKLFKRIRGHLRDDMIAVYEMRGIYRQLVADYEHIYGEVEYKRLRNLADLSISIGELLEMTSKKRIKEDLLDG